MTMNVSSGRNGLVEISTHYTDYLTITIKSFTQVKVDGGGYYVAEL